MENILPVFIFNLFHNLIIQFDSAFSEIWASGLLHIKSFIGGAGSVAFALGSAFLSFLIIIIFMIIIIFILIFIFIIVILNIIDDLFNAKEKYHQIIHSFFANFSSQLIVIS
jgi:hypothetical protein